MHHPEMGETEIRLYLNKALDEYCISAYQSIGKEFDPSSTISPC